MSLWCATEGFRGQRGNLILSHPGCSCQANVIGLFMFNLCSQRYLNRGGRMPRERPVSKTTMTVPWAKTLFLAMVRPVFVVVNTVVCGVFGFLAFLGLGGRLADAGVVENVGYGLWCLAGATSAFLNVVALFSADRPGSQRRMAAYGGNGVPIALAIWLAAESYAIIEGLVVACFAILNVFAIAVISRCGTKTE